MSYAYTYLSNLEPSFVRMSCKLVLKLSMSSRVFKLRQALFGRFGCPLPKCDPWQPGVKHKWWVVSDQLLARVPNRAVGVKGVVTANGTV